MINYIKFNRTILIAALGWLYLLIGLSCNDYNPFQDDSNAKTEFDNRFKNGDTVDLYSTDSIGIFFTAVERIKQVVISCDSNRYFTSDTLDEIEILDPQKHVYYYKFSFYHPDVHYIKTRTVRKNGEIVYNDLKLFVNNVLRPDTVVITSGDSVLLSTPKVKDNVIYHWRLFNLAIDTLVPTIKTKLIINSTDSSSTGRLWVTDLFGRYKSAEVTFHCKYNDTSGPVIMIYNEKQGFEPEPLIVTSDTNYSMKIKVTDNSPKDIRVSVKHGQKSDTLLFKSNDIRSTIIEQINNPQNSNVTIEAKDIRGNTTTRKITVNYNTTAPSSTPYVNVFLSDSENVAITKDTLIRIGGDISFSQGVNRQIQIALIINGVVKDSVIKIVGVNDSTWELTGRLTRLQAPQNDNDVQIISNYVNDTNKVVRSIKYLFNPEYRDRTNATIFKTFASYLEDNREKVSIPGASCNIVRSDSAIVTVIAFDESGIKSVTIDSLPMAQKNNYEWIRWVKVNHQCATYRISVTDSIENITDTTISIVKNKKPFFTRSLDFAKPMVANNPRPYLSSVGYFDEDDILTRPVLLLTKLKSMQQTNENNTFSIVPSLPDTGEHEITMIITDDFEADTLKDTVYITSKLPEPLRIKTRIEEIPSVIQVGTEARFRILADSLTGRAPYFYSLRIMGVDKNPVITYDSVLKWTPDSVLTGRQQIVFVVKDRYDSIAELHVPIQLIRSNIGEKINFKWSGTIKNDTLAVTQDTLDTLILKVNDHDISFRKYTATYLSGPEKGMVIPFTHDSLVIICNSFGRLAGADSLKLEIKDQYNYKEPFTKVIYYGESVLPLITAPLQNEIINGPGVTITWNRCSNTDTLQYMVFIDDIQIDLSTPDTIVTDTTVTFNIPKAGNYFVKVITKKRGVIIASPVIRIKVIAPVRVKWDLAQMHFPAFLFPDSSKEIVVKLIKPAGIGECVLNNVEFTDKDIVSFVRDSLIVVKPRDAALCTLKVIATDRNGNSDTLMKILPVIDKTPTVSVVAKNASKTFSSGDEIDMRYQITDTIFFTINKPVRAIMPFKADIRFAGTQSYTIVDSTMKFNVVLKSRITRKDTSTLNVLISDASGQYISNVSYLVRLNQPKIDYLVPAVGSSYTGINDSIYYSWSLRAFQPGVNYSFVLRRTTLPGQLRSDVSLSSTMVSDTQASFVYTYNYNDNVTFYWQVIAVNSALNDTIMGDTVSFTILPFKKKMIINTVQNSIQERVTQIPIAIVLSDTVKRYYDRKMIEFDRDIDGMSLLIASENKARLADDSKNDAVVWFLMDEIKPSVNDDRIIIRRKTQTLNSNVFENYLCVLHMDTANSNSLVVDACDLNRSYSIKGNLSGCWTQAVPMIDNGFNTVSNSYIEIPDNKVTIPNDTFQMDILFNMLNLRDTATLIEKDSQFTLKILNTGSGRKLVWTCFTDSGVIADTSNASISLNTRYHTVVSFAKGTINMFINGVSEGSKPSKDAFLITSSTSILIGSDGNQKTFSGMLDEFRVRKTLQNDAEVRCTYHNLKPNSSLIKIQ
jgi:hypothetical protein